MLLNTELRGSSSTRSSNICFHIFVLKFRIDLDEPTIVCSIVSSLRNCCVLSDDFTDDSKKEKTEIQSIHPTALIRHSCVCLLQALAIGCGLHGNSLQIESVRTVSSLLHNLLDAGTIG